MGGPANWCRRESKVGCRLRAHSATSFTSWSAACAPGWDIAAPRQLKSCVWKRGSFRSLRRASEKVTPMTLQSHKKLRTTVPSRTAARKILKTLLCGVLLAGEVAPQLAWADEPPAMFVAP